MNKAATRVTTYVVSTFVVAYAGWKLYQYLFPVKREPLAGNMDKITTVTTPSQWNEVYPAIEADLQEFRVLGFDCEWVTRGNLPCPVSLIQLATHRGQCVLVRIKMLSQAGDIPESLTQLLDDNSIMKVGVGCYEDGQRLLRDHKMRVQGCLDLRDVAVITKEFGLGKTTLEGLAKELVGVTFNNLSHSNWDVPRLSDDQVVFAAVDALVALDILLSLLDRHFGAPDGRTLVTVDSDLANRCAALCQGFIDTRFKSPARKAT